MARTRTRRAAGGHPDAAPVSHLLNEELFLAMDKKLLEVLLQPVRA